MKYLKSRIRTCARMQCQQTFYWNIDDIFKFRINRFYCESCWERYIVLFHTSTGLIASESIPWFDDEYNKKN